MFLAIDVGNTQTTLGLFDADGALVRGWRMATDASDTSDSLHARLFSYFAKDGLDLAAVGDAVVAGDLCEWDINITALGEVRGYIEKLGTVHIASDRQLSDKLAAAAAAQGLTVHRGTIVSGDTFVADSRLKKMLHATFGALCGEMEGAACAHTAALNGVPFAVLRCVSDGGDPDAQMDYPRFKKTAAAKSTATVLAFLQTLGKKEEGAG